MELWIRSQDKEVLVKINNIWVNENVIYTDSYPDMWLGAYKSEKRALEVLDEIQKKIKMLIYLKPNTLLKLEDLKAAKKYFEQINKQEFFTCDSNFEIIPFSTNVIVYEMPKE